MQPDTISNSQSTEVQDLDFSSDPAIKTSRDFQIQTKCFGEQISLFQASTPVALNPRRHTTQAIVQIPVNSNRRRSPPSEISLKECSSHDSFELSSVELRKRISVLEEKCYNLTCKRLDVQIETEGEIELLLSQNNRLVKENYFLKQQYFDLSTQFNDVVTICNNLVRSLEERDIVKTKMAEMTSLAESLSSNIECLQHDIITTQSNRAAYSLAAVVTAAAYVSQESSIPEMHEDEPDEYSQEGLRHVEIVNDESSDAESVYYDALDYFQ